MFNSELDYRNFFIPLLFEETRADLFSSLYGVSQAPFYEIENVEEIKKRTIPISEDQIQFIQFEYVIPFKSKHEFDDDENIGNYKPVSGDLIAFTHIRPRSINDLNTLKSPYRIAYVKEAKKEFFRNGDGPRTLYIRISFLTSKCMKMDVESDLQNNKELKLYAVYLMNMTTNVRIWKALKSISHMNIIKTVLGPRKLVSIIF
jgi:senataxin